ncbi:type VI secretion system contractile sheath small subunit [Xenorhabdus bovienii]|uniref:Type VI secretion protein n=1 Tax=Xenorhabdus bovienii str. Intermedium TaxID=1379677 RepID=A0A077QNU7_XENBV|nr:type VI secretion system contractile sheath small subunit [Xenorhabdus bovienii]MDE9442220.1 type VI secretion system contractile sheath small subunit [Xenorhabdus bovienii]MDE9480413.1 type VI secretion system contractile sheath small subunit [Xenorhabdus bovienii]MDE9543018.1 type VI secretion system contractile sheath small subunit [Xenorhabdus bovienii]MDE9551630.1 type VI secretion system contractile sheath small subunit [Xenorhabdus bovienii]MDE9555707.1 type VI secretion system contr
MSKNSPGSVAPKERINIKYVPNTGDQTAEVELPLNLLVVGDLKGKKEDTPIEERQTVSVNKNNFNAVMNEANINLTFNVPNRLDEKSEEDMPVNLEIKSLSDFSPDNIAKKVPELNKLLELREALVALKGPLGNIPAFRTRLQSLLDDESVREQLLKELEIVNKK